MSFQKTKIVLWKLRVCFGILLRMLLLNQIWLEFIGVVSVQCASMFKIEKLINSMYRGNIFSRNWHFVMILWHNPQLVNSNLLHQMTRAFGPYSPSPPIFWERSHEEVHTLHILLCLIPKFNLTHCGQSLENMPRKQENIHFGIQVVQFFHLKHR